MREMCACALDDARHMHVGAMGELDSKRLFEYTYTLSSSGNKGIFHVVEAV